MNYGILTALILLFLTAPAAASIDRTRALGDVVLATLEAENMKPRKFKMGLSVVEDQGRTSMRFNKHKSSVRHYVHFPETGTYTVRAWARSEGCVNKLRISSSPKHTDVSVGEGYHLIEARLPVYRYGDRYLNLKRLGSCPLYIDWVEVEKLD